MPRFSRLFPFLLVLCLLAVVPAASTAAAPAYPSVSKVSPLKLGVGDTLALRGKNFRSGKNRNTVVFKRTGGRAVFVKAAKATRTTIRVTIPAKLLPALAQRRGKPVATRFRVRVLAGRFGRRYTAAKASPVIGPAALAKKVTAADCDGDLKPNATDDDDDNDILSDLMETSLKTDPCNRDSDGDGMSDGWEHLSALDYNGRALPTPLRRPYPNALDAKDGKVDSDGDGLTNVLEYAAWATFGRNGTNLSYSGGNPASTGKERVTAANAWWDRDGNGFLSDNERDADGDGIANQDEGGVGPLPVIVNVVGFFADEYIALDAVRSIVDVVPLYGPLDYVHKIQGTSWLDADSDGDTIRDDADDQDMDGVSNVSETLSELATPLGERQQLPVNPCAPSVDARLCIAGDVDTNGDGEPNRVDDDDDGDGMGDDLERSYRLNPYRWDTDGDGVSDGFEHQSAIDLNVTSAAFPVPVPYPGKRPYPNPLDGSDAQEDYDGDGLTLTDEYRAWRYDESPPTLSYSDGSLYTGGRGARLATDDPRDHDASGFLSDDEKDVDRDGLSNWDEAHGRMTPMWWELTYKAERVYPGRTFKALDLANWDTDDDKLRDGDDDEDHDGFTNALELERPSDWQTTYVSTMHPGTNTRARVNPFNPCKPFYSNTCHRYPPFDYYPPSEDWESPVRKDGPLP